MSSSAPASPGISARIIHGSLVLGVLLFWAMAWFVGRKQPAPALVLPSPRVLYLALFLACAVPFGAAIFAARRLPSPVSGSTEDEWWRLNLGRAILIWALVEAPALLGLTAFFLTRDARVLIAALASLLLFASYRPSRLFER